MRASRENPVPPHYFDSRYRFTIFTPNPITKTQLSPPLLLRPVFGTVVVVWPPLSVFVLVSLLTLLQVRDSLVFFAFYKPMLYDINLICRLF